MQKNQLLLPLLAVLLFFLSIYTVYNKVVLEEQIEKLQAQIEKLQTPKQTIQTATENNEDKEFPLGEYMGKLQYYAHKAGLAGKYKNWALAGFYVHELEETIEFLVAQNIVDEGVQVSNLLKNILPMIEELEKNAKEANAVEFPKTYQTLLRNCNNCHISSNKPYIVVEPAKQDFDGQQFKP
jgi:SNF family Na+-dependent transporter